MIVVNCGLMQEKIKEIINEQSNGIIKFEKKEGIKLFFSTPNDDKDYVNLIKQMIKNDPIAKTLLFSVKKEGQI